MAQNKTVKLDSGVRVKVNKYAHQQAINDKIAALYQNDCGKFVSSEILGIGHYQNEDAKTTNLPAIIPEKKTKNIKFLTVFIVSSIFCIPSFICFYLQTIEYNLITLIIGINCLAFGLGYIWAILPCRKPKQKSTNELIKESKIKIDETRGDRQQILKNFVFCNEIIAQICEEELIIKALKEKIAINQTEKLQNLLAEHEQKLVAFEQKLDENRFDADKDVTELKMESYKGLYNQFEHLMDSEKIWKPIIKNDLITKQEYLDRTNGSVYFGSFDFIKSQFAALVFDNGVHKIYFYPKFIIVSTNATDFSVLEHSSDTLAFEDYHVNETKEEPKDAKLIGSKFMHETKNGSPDGRYSYNPLITTYAYAKLTIADETQKFDFLFSNVVYGEYFHKFYLLFLDYKTTIDENGNTTPKIEYKLKSNIHIKPIFESKNAEESKNFDEEFNRQVAEAEQLQTEKIDYSEISQSAIDLYNYLNDLSDEQEILTILKQYDKELSGLDIFNLAVNSRLALLTLNDAIKCYERLGYKLNLSRKESIGLSIFVNLIRFGEVDFVENREEFMRFNNEHTLEILVNKFRKSIKMTIPDNKYFVIEIMKNGGLSEGMIKKYALLLYRFALILAKSDGVIEGREKDCLRNLLSFADKSDLDAGDYLPEENDSQNKTARKRSKGGAQRQLDELIGLEPVKSEVEKLVNFVKVQNMRASKGLPTSPISYHYVFTGNPGTGKTTVARILSEIYKELGVLAKGHLVETDRSGLVAEYVGQTAVKTNNIIDSALDGVLFIDEAYSLSKGGSNDYGNEAIATLLKRMEDDRSRLVVILAGYDNEMKGFIDSNPGLQSRFNRYIDFVDYTADDLMKIFELNIKKYDYELTENATEKLQKLFETAVANKDENFGNGRFARNILEKVLENQAMRLTAENSITEEKLRLIIDEDIPNFN